MAERTPHIHDVHVHLEGHLALGAAVLRQAILDARRSDDLGEEARRFLTSEDLSWWAELLGLDPAAVTARMSSDRQAARSTPG